MNTELKLRGGHAVIGAADDAEAYVAKLAAELGRKCGSCSLCCKLLNIDTHEITKSANQWCQHCRPGHGCAIYDRRPFVCRAFACQWMGDDSFGPEWYPTRSKMVLRMRPNELGALSLDVNVDPAYPTAWRKSPYYEHLVDRSTRIGVSIYVGDRQIGLRGCREYELKRNERAIVHSDETMRRIGQNFNDFNAETTETMKSPYETMLKPSVSGQSETIRNHAETGLKPG